MPKGHFASFSLIYTEENTIRGHRKGPIVIAYQLREGG